MTDLPPLTRSELEMVLEDATRDPLVDARRWTDGEVAHIAATALHLAGLLDARTQALARIETDLAHVRIGVDRALANAGEQIVGVVR